MNVTSVRANGAIGDTTGPVAVAASQPQTVTVSGGNQVTERRVILADASGSTRATASIPFP